jgi:tryptophanyl-tRNA synthetase
MSLRDGTAKMSKSDPSDMSRVNLADDPDEVMKKVKKAKTDPNRCRARRRGSRAGPRRSTW